MVPVVLLQLAGLPLSANGKLDRKALPLPDLTPRVKGRAPQSATEIAVAAAFSACWAVRLTTLKVISLRWADTRCWR